MTSRVPALPLALLLAAAPATAAPRIQPELPPENARYSQGSVVVSDTTPDAWWESFGDPALDALVTEAVELSSFMEKVSGTTSRLETDSELGQLDIQDWVSFHDTSPECDRFGNIAFLRISHSRGNFSPCRRPGCGFR